MGTPRHRLIDQIRSENIRENNAQCEWLRRHFSPWDFRTSENLGTSPALSDSLAPGSGAGSSDAGLRRRLGSEPMLNFILIFGKNVFCL